MVSGNGFDVAAIIQQTADQVQGDLFVVLGIVVPAIALVTAAVVSVSFGFKWVKRMGKG